MEYGVIVTGMCCTNTYILNNGGSAIIVDPGDEYKSIIELLKSKSLTPKYIVVTHNHFDHVGAIARLKAEYRDIKVYAPELDFNILKDAGFVCDCFAAIPVEPFEADVTVGDGDEFQLLGSSFKVIGTPGHTPGSVCYLVDNSVLVTGDTLFRRSIGRTDFPGGDGRLLRESIEKLYELGGDYTVLPGHGEPTTLEEERNENPYVSRNS